MIYRIALLSFFLGFQVISGVIFATNDARAEEVPLLQTFVSLPNIMVEFWDEDGIYHRMDLTVTLQCKVPVTPSTKFAGKIRLALTSHPWKYYTENNAALLIKSIVKQELQEESYAFLVEEILITNLLTR